MAEPKPQLGDQVHIYYPNIHQRVGFTNGHDGRGEGPYLGLVTNERGAGLAVAIFIPPHGLPDCRRVMGKGESGPGDPYWDWTSPLDKARAVKRAQATD